ncbi:metalloregulator ArsR/SmtB family transcription factor [Stappia sp. GBMRC 2046]|uniref:Metalloregulator ArsR/SmtB family transcription factor n=1 Tax=Stappia sediminis TaxID=2692190 RepID=A0A7X3LUP0_9HYPH|nr:helix-turn-helix domain-containing protein [Stappia sediminis]MXN65452.1 metalloregulator ArsR/SmtB family transcription factor [Stappia sediminis]
MEKIDALAALSALGQETRLDVYRLLVKAGRAGLAAGEVAEELGVLPNTLSNHLANLSRAGLVRQTREGRVLRYTADFARMRGLLDYLMADCCGGRPEICAPFMEGPGCSEHEEKTKTA